MKNLEIVKIKIENLREILKFLLLLVLAILTGLVTLTFWILTKKVEVYFIIFVGIGLVVLWFLYLVIKFVWEKMENYLKEIDE